MLEVINKKETNIHIDAGKLDGLDLINEFRMQFVYETGM